jgi:DNA invertase Pin-like site-specific DNA recombinase
MDIKRSGVAYCRVSTLEQKRKGYGIDIQMRDLTLFAERQEFFIDRFYKDEAESGVAADRTALRRLLRDCRAGRVGTVIIPTLDRLSRDLRLAENLFHEFEQLGVRILIADMPTYNGKDRKDVLIRQIREAIAEENRKDIIDRLWKGRQERVRRGLPPGGNVPYGYRRTAKGFARDPAEAEIVKLIFRLAERGVQASEVALTLNDQGLARRNGRSWTPRQVLAILGRRMIYTAGVLRYGDACGGDRSLALIAEQKRIGPGRVQRSWPADIGG